MRNPNGYGSVVKLSGNRRNPFCVRKTKGWNDKGHPIYDTIGYFPTREAGMIALAEYNRNPYDVDKAKITLDELFQKWSERKLPKLSPSLQSSLKNAYTHTKQIQGMKYRDIRSFHMQDCIDNCGCGYSVQGAMKNLFGHLDRFAMELDVIFKMYSPLVSAAPIPETSKVPFTDDEVNQLWGIQNQEWVDTVLILLYSGWRITELLTLRTENVDLKAGTMKGGIKTRNGKDRIVPIHPKIEPFVERWVNRGFEYLITDERGHRLSDGQYRPHFKAIMEQLGFDHCPHECRHTLRSRLDSAGANKKCIDLILGHKSKDVGERVYTHKTIEELKQAIELISR